MPRLLLKQQTIGLGSAEFVGELVSDQVTLVLLQHAHLAVAHYPIATGVRGFVGIDS
jgi:hypothetical protein